jgi:copper chaperone CopZ
MQKTLKVTGMSCEHCVKAVTAAIKSVSGAQCPKVDLAKGTASFRYKDEATADAVIAAIKEQEYGVE